MAKKKENTNLRKFTRKTQITKKNTSGMIKKIKVGSISGMITRIKMKQNQ